MEHKPSPGQYAGFVSRFIAFVTDIVVVGSVTALASAVVGLILGFFGLDDTLLADVLAAIMGLLGVALFFGYPIFFWLMIGQTPGKALLGLRLVRVDGQRLTLGRAICRLLAYWISALPLFLGFAWVLIDDRRQGWHDKIAGTCVIYS